MKDPDKQDRNEEVCKCQALLAELRTRLYILTVDSEASGSFLDEIGALNRLEAKLGEEVGASSSKDSSADEEEQISVLDGLEAFLKTRGEAAETVYETISDDDWRQGFHWGRHTLAREVLDYIHERQAEVQ